MRPDEYRRYREALSTRVHEVILALEARGCTFRLADDGSVKVAPADRLTAADLEALRTHRDAVALLIRHRDAWCEWPLAVAPFDPAKAFLPASLEVH